MMAGFLGIALSVIVIAMLVGAWFVIRSQRNRYSERMHDEHEDVW